MVLSLIQEIVILLLYNIIKIEKPSKASGRGAMEYLHLLDLLIMI